jgi:hypothetical protein
MRKCLAAPRERQTLCSVRHEEQEVFAGNILADYQQAESSARKRGASQILYSPIEAQP